MNDTAPSILRLIGAQKAEFNHASKLRTWVLRVQVAIGGLAAVSLIWTSEAVLYVFAVLALALTATWLFLGLDLAASRSHAERLRRATMIAGGLGVELTGAELIELSNGGKASHEEAKRLIDPNYFATQAAPGVPRFVGMLEESAIWTANLAGVAAREATMVMGGTVVVTIAVLFASVGLVNTSIWQMGARMIFAILSVILSLDFLGSAKAYADAQQSILRVIERLRRYKEGAGSLEALMIVFADYNSTVETMPVFSSGLYPRNEKRLNEQYQMYLTGPQ